MHFMPFVATSEAANLTMRKKKISGWTFWRWQEFIVHRAAALSVSTIDARRSAGLESPSKTRGVMKAPIEARRVRACLFGKRM